MTNAANDRIELIQQRLTEQLTPSQLRVIDESHLHEGHQEAEASGGGHYFIEITSDQFEGKSQVERHRMIYAALGDAMGTEIHALSIQAQTEPETQQAAITSASTEEEE